MLHTLFHLLPKTALTWQNGLPIFDFRCVVFNDSCLMLLRSYQLDGIKDQSSSPIMNPVFYRFNMQSEPYSTLGITESVRWNKVNRWLGPLSLYPCLKSLSIPAEFRIHWPETRSNLAAIDPFPNQTQDLLNMLTTSE